MLLENLDRAEIISINDAEIEDFQSGKIITGDGALFNSRELARFLWEDLNQRQPSSIDFRRFTNINLRIKLPVKPEGLNLSFEDQLAWKLRLMRFHGQMGDYAFVRLEEPLFEPLKENTNLRKKYPLRLIDSSSLLLCIGLNSTGKGRVASLYMAMGMFLQESEKGRVLDTEAILLKLDRTRLAINTLNDRSSATWEQVIRNGLKNAFQAGLPSLGKGGR